MGERRECPDCGHTVVLVYSGGVHRTILCEDCNREMRHEGSVETEFDTLSEGDDYRIVE